MTKPIFIGDNMHQRVKIQAAREGITMRNLAELALDSYITMMHDQDRARVLVDEREPYTVKEATE